MIEKKYSRIFLDIVRSLDCNQYAISMYVAKLSRQICINNPVVLSSEAIDWIVTGNKPSILNKPHIEVNQSFNRCREDTIIDALEWVTDEIVKENVITSVNWSISNHHLIYTYNNVQDDNVKARIRILVRMIWYELKDNHLI